MEIVELRVRMDCSGCERRVRKKLAKLKGVNHVDIDPTMNKVIVMGYVDQGKVLRALRRKTGKRAEFWSHGYISNPNNIYYNHKNNNRNYPYKHTSNYMLQHQAFNSCTYERHGCNNYDFLEVANQCYGGRSNAITKGSTLKDENPNACCFM